MIRFGIIYELSLPVLAQLPSMPEQLDTFEAFETTVLKAPEDKLVVVDFWATWCGPCIRFSPTFEKMAGELSDVLFFKVDVDKNAQASEHAKISCMPTFKIYKAGKCLDTIEGASEAKLRESITKNK